MRQETAPDGVTLEGNGSVSTDSGEKGVAQELVAETVNLVAAAQAQEAEQLELMGVPSPEAMRAARETLGPKAGALAVVNEARRRGRPRGSRNRATQDFKRYILGFGQHPAITMMQIQSTPPEVLVAQSKEMDPAKRRMTYGEAQALRVRCAEGLMPFIESKQPVAVELGVNGDFNLLIPGLNVTADDAAAAAAGEFVLADWSPVEDGEDGAE